MWHRAIVAFEHWWDTRHAPSGIYGTVICASVLATGFDLGSVVDVCKAVIIAVLVYWVAERWSQVVGVRLAGERLTWRRIRRTFSQGWAMVQASYLPLVALIVAKLLGASLVIAVDVALLVSVGVLAGLGAVAAKRAGYPASGRLASAALTGALGLVLVGLKAALH